MSKSYIIIITIIVFRYFVFFTQDSWVQYCYRDIKFCPQCFKKNCCSEYFLKRLITISSEFETNINTIFGRRRIQRGIWKFEDQIHNVVLKYLPKKDMMSSLKHSLCANATIFLKNKMQNSFNCDRIWQLILRSEYLPDILGEMYKKSTHINGFKFCPEYSTEFFQTFNQFKTNITFWMQLWINPELVILKAIQNSKYLELKYAVPKVIAWCGFAILEEDTGSTTLVGFYDNPFKQRIYLAQQLLKIAIAFSYGLNGFR